METNYELKLKNLLVPLKAILLVLAMVLVGFTTYAQQGKAIKVANDQQLLEALKNPSVSVVELSAGYYPSVNYTAKEGTHMEKAPNGGGRNLDCQYYIFDGNVCVPTAFVYVDPSVNEIGVDPIPPGSYYLLEARAGANDPGGICGCCPNPNTGTWSFILADSDLGGGDTIYAANLPNTEESYWYVTGPGVYSLRYSWGAPYNSFVQTEYVFRGPNNLELDAPDVCGTSTTVDFVLDGLYSSFTFDVDWVLHNLNTNMYYPITGPNATGQFTLDVTNYGGCGQYELIAEVFTHYDEASEDECSTTISTTIDFSCGPQVDAGPDVWVCNDLCYSYFVADVDVAYWSPDYSYSWYQISGPGTLEFNPDPNQFVVGVCREEFPPVCSYGTYEVEFQVQNGECYAEDDKEITFYQQPTADAGTSWDICNEFTFNLNATPFVYCGAEGVNYWATRNWELVSWPAGAVVTFDANNPDALVTITGTGCLYGEYTFKWREWNSKNIPAQEGCYAEDLVTVTIYEDPQPVAGNDLVLCETFAFSLYGIGDDVCFTGTEVTYTWEKTAQPGDCEILFSDLNVLNPQVSIENCNDASCEYGKYTFTLTQSNSGVCTGSDAVDVWIFQEPEANAGGDQTICYDFDYTVGFNLNATFFAGYCGTAGVNYFQFGEWEFVSGPTAAVTIADPSNPGSGVSIDMESVPCPYGAYTFRWTEYNGFGLPFQGCQDFDEVVIYVSESPESVSAGPDLAFCNNFAFSLNGTADMPCTQFNAYQLEWGTYSTPGGCNVTFNTPNSEDPGVTISGCTGCQYGEYVFTLTQKNGYFSQVGGFVEVCSFTDTVSVWIFEEVNANAGTDQHLCNDFTFDLLAAWTPFTCGVEGTNFFSTGYWEAMPTNPAPATFGSANTLGTSVAIDPTGIACPYGEYQFKWTERNGFVSGNPMGYCEDDDIVSVYIYETPEVGAGSDYALCNTYTFPLNGVVDEPCVDGMQYRITWTAATGNPGNCTANFMYPNSAMTYVTLDNCGACPYGDFVFIIHQENGYYNDMQEWVMVCEDYDEVTVTIYQQPEGVDAGMTQNLCEDYTFDLTANGADYCGPHSNWYEWTVVSQPAGASCTITFTNPTSLNTGVEISGCTGDCAFGEFVFKFTEWNGDVNVNCWDDDVVSVFIFEAPDAEAGPDVNNCLAADAFPYCTDFAGQFDYCYSMNSLWTKTCGPGMVQFEDPTDPTGEICFEEPGRYKFNYKLWNVAEGCEDNDEVIFDLLEQPEAISQVEELTAECDELCVNILDGMIVKYEYFGTDQGECPNFQDFANWSYVDGPVAGYNDPATVTFSPDDNPVTEICVSYYGGYTVRWSEVNRAVDGLSECTDYVDIFIEFYETPTPDAGPGGELCGNCFTLQGVPYAYLPYPNQHLSDYLWWESLSTNPCPVTFGNFEEAVTEVCIPDVGSCYGTYGFVLHQQNGECFGTDTVWVTFKDTPPDFAICFDNNPNDCGDFDGGAGPDFVHYGCLLPNDVLEVCAEGTSHFYMGPWCYCQPGFDWYDPANYGWSFEWSLISPAGTLTESQAGYYDYEAGQWIFPYINIIWGECCDTARLYLTATNPEGCERTLEYKMFVFHKPCIDIVGTDATPFESEVGAIEGYCNNCPPNPCLLYNWTAEHCGEIVEGQGTECIEVLWTNYNINGGIGQITLTVFDTCTGCCNYDVMDVKIYPTGTLGSATLAGHVYYENNNQTPLNGVEITLWNAGVPVMTTTSFNDIEGGNGLGYYAFNNLNATTNFGITANYTAPWYGANATDALAVELRAINSLPGGFFVNQPLQEEAMDVNNINGINGTDALWIKQRAISMVGYFPAGNWAYVPGMSSQAGTYDVKLLTMGDANRSNIPASMKAMPAIDLVNDGMMNVVNGEVFELPIRIAKADVFGAMTLHLEYNSSVLEVIDVVAMEGMLSNISNGTISVAWSNTNPMALTDNDVVITLKAKAIGEIASTESLFRIGLESEFADPTANVIEPVTLKSFGVTTEPAALDYFLSSNRPNPFSTTTTIEYTMPETGKVRLSVLDMLGQEIDVLVESTQKAGRYEVNFSAAGLATGVYLYKITVDGETRDFISTQRMVITH